MQLRWWRWVIYRNWLILEIELESRCTRWGWNFCAPSWSGNSCSANCIRLVRNGRTKIIINCCAIIISFASIHVIRSMVTTFESDKVSTKTQQILCAARGASPSCWCFCSIGESERKRAHRSTATLSNLNDWFCYR